MDKKSAHKAEHNVAHESTHLTVKQTYAKIRPELKNELGFSSVMQVPTIKKVVINMGLGKATTDKSIIKDALEELTKISGQLAVSTKSKKSNASFKIREDMPIGVKVTLRGHKMYDFLEKLLKISLPRIRDFRGVSSRSFDGRGSYSLGIKEFIIFPEIDLDKVRHMKGADITIVTSAKKDEHAYILLKKLGMPFSGPFRGGK